jgi:hypothetical protein
VGIVKVVTLVPWRGGDELREQSWEIVRPYLERFGWRVYLGDRRTVEPRRGHQCGSEDAGNWDVAVIADADTIPPEVGSCRRDCFAERRRRPRHTIASTG